MKNLLWLVCFVALNYYATAQLTNEDVSGVYEVTYDSTNALIIDKLTLNPDGTFVFHEYDKHDNGLPPERNKYAKGTWRADKMLIYFSSDKTDFDDTYTLDFNNTKARYIRKSARDLSERNIKTALQFYDSEIFWITGRTLFKVE